jgi:hypothetical protein
MKKVFTILELIAAILLLTLIVLFLTNYPTQQQTNQPTQQMHNSFTVISKEGTGSYCCDPHLIIVKDNQTNQEYIIVEDASGVSVIPRLPKKE